MGPKNREALFKLELGLQAVGEDIFTLFLMLHMLGWCGELISCVNMIVMFLRENS